MKASIRALVRLLRPASPPGWRRARRSDAAALRAASHVLIHADAAAGISDVGLIVPGRPLDLGLPIPVLLPDDRPDAVAGAFLATGRPAVTAVSTALDMIRPGDLVRFRWRAEDERDALELEIERRGRVMVLALESRPSGAGVRRRAPRAPQAAILPFGRRSA